MKQLIYSDFKNIIVYIMILVIKNKSCDNVGIIFTFAPKMMNNYGNKEFHQNNKFYQKHYAIDLIWNFIKNENYLGDLKLFQCRFLLLTRTVAVTRLKTVGKELVFTFFEFLTGSDFLRHVREIDKWF